MTNQSLRILVVDDHPLVRAGLQAGIRAAFPAARVGEAGSASEALASISARHPDLILLDVNLPGQSGIELARRIRAVDKRVKLLMVAAEADPWTVKETLEVGASGFMTKMCSVDSLGQAMKAVLAGQVFLCADSQAAVKRAEPRAGLPADALGPVVLSKREREILKHLAYGENTKTIAISLQISPKTVETHRQRIMRKLRIDSVAALTRYAVRHGLTVA